MKGGDNNSPIHSGRHAGRMAPVRFLIIGAQKAGTTSLFEYTRGHPDIYMPPEKEVPFFEADRTYRRGFSWYSQTVTRAAPAGAICGTASVGYMTGTPLRDIPLDKWDDSQLPRGKQIEDIIPLRIREMLPDVKLLCVLRDPVERALSHYRMALLDGLESRTFDTAIAQLLEPRALRHARAVATGHNGYVARGEYGRILGGFLRVFSRDQLMVILSDDLSNKTSQVLPSVFRFIDVSPNFEPSNLNKRYRAGAVKQRAPGLNLYTWRAKLARNRPTRTLWERIPSNTQRVINNVGEVVSYRVGLWNAHRGLTTSDMDGSVRQALITHFRDDSAALAASLDIKLPWLEAWGS